MKLEDLNPLDIFIETVNIGSGCVPRPVGIKITHIESGAEFICTEHHSQHKNRQQALNELVEHLTIVEG